MEIKIPFTDKKFTGELRWNFPETEEQKEQIAFNNSVVNVALLMLSVTNISLALSLMAIFLIFIQCCRRELMLYAIGDKFYLLSVILQGIMILTSLGIIIDIFFEFRISIARIIVWSCIAFYIYTWRAEIKEFYSYFKSKPWF